MKTANIFKAAVLAAVLGGAASCSENTDPTFKSCRIDPSTFTIYNPSIQDLYYELTEDGTFELTLSGQPSYGFSTVTQYRAEVALTPDGFNDPATYRVLTPTGTGTLSRMTLKDLDLAVALCSLRGIDDVKDYTDAGVQTVYFRGYAYIENVPDSEVSTANYTTLNKVQSFFAVDKPGVIYVIGNYAGAWIGPEEANEAALAQYTLSENPNEVRSKVYHGAISFDPAIAADEGSIFRFYTALDGWDKSSIGPNGGPDDDKPVEFPDFATGSTLERGLTKTKDSFKFNNYRGNLTFTVNLNQDKENAIIVAPAD